jgi:DUF971 family protein
MALVAPFSPEKMMSATKPIPTRIDSFSEREMLLGWSTGENFSVPYAEIRFLCPCAGCVDENTGKRTIQRGSIPEGIKPTGARPVGRYAIQIDWNDGHTTGLYHYETLYQICRESGRGV